MNVTHVPQKEIVTLARIVDLSPEEGEDEEVDFGDESIKPGRYAMDGTGTVWRREDTISAMFQEFMDLAEGLKPKKGVK